MENNDGWNTFADRICSGRTSNCNGTELSMPSVYWWPKINLFLDAIPDIFVILNEQRQIVFANKPLLEFLGLNDIKDTIGQRPGEILSCENAFKSEGGCGTTEFCKTCGSVNAIITSLSGKRDI